MSQKEITFVTGNTEKLSVANVIGKPYGITFKQSALNIDEIQSEDASIIVRDKANKAYQLAGRSIVVNDDSWIIPGLNGFPGPYMKSINHWFTAEDFLRLTKPLRDRRVILAQYTVYQNEHGQQLFQQNIEGLLLPKLYGEPRPNSRMMALVSFDNGASSVAENFAKGQPSIDQYRTTWHDFAEWYSEKNIK